MPVSAMFKGLVMTHMGEMQTGTGAASIAADTPVAPISLVPPSLLGGLLLLMRP